MPSLRRRDVIATLSASIASTMLPKAAFAAPIQSCPPTRIDPVVDDYFGTKVIDRYRWMETQPPSVEFKTWLQAQGAFARTRLDELPRRGAITRSLSTYLADQDFAYLAETEAGRLFIMRRQVGQQVIRLFMREGDDGPERLVVDPGQNGAGGSEHASFEHMTVAPDGRYIAYSVSTAGSEIATTYLFDIDANTTTQISKLSSRPCGWLSAARGFFYYRLRPDAKFGASDYRKGGSCWLHMIGSDPARDVEVFRSGEGSGYETQESDTPVVKGAPNSEWVVGIHLLNDNFSNQVYVARTADVESGHAKWRKIAGRAANVQEVHVVENDIYLLANGRQSQGELVKVDAATGIFDTAPVALSASEGVIDLAVVARDGLYVHDLTDGMGGLRRVGHDGSVVRIKPPRSGALWGLCAERDEDGLWFGMDDLTQFGETFHLKRPQAPPRIVAMAKFPAFDVTRFQTTRASVRARDGAEIPVEIMHQRNVKLNGTNPVLIVAYGAYGTILDPGFDTEKLAFLAQGGVFVYAHVRGGGEKGEAWHNAGRKATKPNTWRDAIDTAEWLIANRWTGKKHLAIWGTSAGGIMVGRAITERPDLFAAAVCEVGELNALRFELTANGPGNDAEFGTVKTPEGFRALLAQDCIQAVQDGVRYPATLVMTGANDQRVEPWISGKFSARLQAASTNHPGALLRVDYDAGHFTDTMAGRMQRATDVFSFVFAHT